MIIVCDSSPIITLAFCDQLELLDKLDLFNDVLIPQEVYNDEKKGRKTAIARGINVVGSLGVLILAKKKGFLQSIKPSIDILQLSSSRISDFLYEQALKMAGEITD